jgi:hypothetical protein
LNKSTSDNIEIIIKLETMCDDDIYWRIFYRAIQGARSKEQGVIHFYFKKRKEDEWNVIKQWKTKTSFKLIQCLFDCITIQYYLILFICLPSFLLPVRSLSKITKRSIYTVEQHSASLI